MIITTHKGFKFRLYPTEEQISYFNQTFGAVRWMWNTMLHDKIEYYKQNNKTLKNTPAQYKEENDWLNELDSWAFCNVQMELEKAYKKFYKNKSVGFPKYKSKKSCKKSYKTNKVSKISDKYIKLPKIGDVKYIKSRELPDDYLIKSATISCNSCNEYCISLTVEYKVDIPEKELDKSNAIGLDFSMPEFYVDSQGTKCGYPKFFREAHDLLAKEQRKLSKMKNGSNNYNKQKLKVAKVQNHIKNQRYDWIHCLSKQLADEYDIVCVEDINLQNMQQCLNFGKSISDLGFGMFRTILNYKLQERGKKLIKIDRWFPSSKTCHCCGTVNEDLTLQDREWTCSSCGELINRDLNAALNIRDIGISNI